MVTGGSHPNYQGRPCLDCDKNRVGFFETTTLGGSVADLVPIGSVSTLGVLVILHTLIYDIFVNFIIHNSTWTDAR